MVGILARQLGALPREGEHVFVVPFMHTKTCLWRDAVSCLRAKQVGPVNWAAPMAPPFAVCSVKLGRKSQGHQQKNKKNILWDTAIQSLLRHRLLLLSLEAQRSGELKETRQCVLINLTSPYSESTVSPFQRPWKKKLWVTTRAAEPMLPKNHDNQTPNNAG